MRENLVRHKTVIIIAAAVLLTGIGFAAGMMAKSSLASGSKDIGVDAAKQIALSSVGVSIEKATFTKEVLEGDEYEIDFYTQSNEYDFEINARTGAIIDKEVSPRDLTLPEEGQAEQPDKSADSVTSADSGKSDSGKSGSQESVKQTESTKAPTKPVVSNSDDDVIGVSAAKSIALKHAGLSSASFTEASLDYDDGIRIYDINFVAGGKSYDYEINAYTGAIIEYDIEAFDYDDDDDDDDD